MILLSQYKIYIGYIFTECSLPYVGWFFVEKKQITKKLLKLGFHREGHKCCLHMQIILVYFK